MKLAQHNLETHFRDNPCRFIVLGVTEEGLGAQVAGIMGRSFNSQNRIYVVKDGMLRTEAADPSKVDDPRLIIYNVMKSMDRAHVISNGDQTDSVLEDGLIAVLDVKAFYYALKRRHCEPDAPVFTPRITGCQFSYDMNNIFLSVLKAEPFAKEHWKQTEIEANVVGVTRKRFERNGLAQREVSDIYLDDIDRRARLDHHAFPTLYREFEQKVKPGFGYCLTTYMPGSKELPSFSGEPLLVPMKGTIEQIMQTFWEALEPEWRVAVEGRIIHKNNRVVYVKPINRYQPME